MVKYSIARLRNSLYIRYVQWCDNRLENKKRSWQAFKIGGGGVVPLGRVNQEMAISKVSKFGSIQFVDTSVACIFYSDKH